MGRPTTRGRPRTFDEDAVIHRVLHTLWQHGYHATSMNDLARAVGVSKPALYNAIGDKTELLKHALNRYCANSGARLQEVMNVRPASARARATWQVFIEQFCDDASPPGCFLVSTTLECSNQEDLVDFIRKLHDQNRVGTRTFLAEDQTRGELSAEVDVDALAGFINGQSFALAVMARNGASRGELERFADMAESMIQPLCRTP